jgi:hypothetical protein
MMDEYDYEMAKHLLYGGSKPNPADYPDSAEWQDSPQRVRLEIDKDKINWEDFPGVDPDEEIQLVMPVGQEPQYTVQLDGPDAGEWQRRPIKNQDYAYKSGFSDIPGGIWDGISGGVGAVWDMAMGKHGPWAQAAVLGALATVAAPLTAAAASTGTGAYVAGRVIGAGSAAAAGAKHVSKAASDAVRTASEAISRISVDPKAKVATDFLEGLIDGTPPSSNPAGQVAGAGKYFTGVLMDEMNKAKSKQGNESPYGSSPPSTNAEVPEDPDFFGE